MTAKRTFQVGIIGWPIGHTRSPAMHHAAAQALGLDLHYAARAIEPTQLEHLMRERTSLPADGFNVTVPHKETVIPYLDALNLSAQKAGAVNTIVVRDHALIGYNTDAPGLVNALQDSHISAQDKSVVVIGAGGAARAAVIAASSMNAHRILIAARNPAQAKALIESLTRRISTHLEFVELSSQTWAQDADIVIQATSATMSTSTDADEFAASLHIDRFPRHCAVVDLVYAPLETSVLRLAHKRGLQTADGLGMLIHQGALAFELWTGQKPSLSVMRAAASGAEV